MPYLLLILLIVCHFVADYCLTTRQMLEAKASGKRVHYIALHAGVHAVLMSGVLLACGTSLQLVALLFAIEFASHFIIDYAKGLVGRCFPVCADVQKKAFWVVYGLDQLLHLLVIVAMLWLSTGQS